MVGRSPAAFRSHGAALNTNVPPLRTPTLVSSWSIGCSRCARGGPGAAGSIWWLLWGGGPIMLTCSTAGRESAFSGSSRSC
jgi:hypothetical protein